jgi:hypothetical protein
VNGEFERAEKQQLSSVFRYYPSLCLEGVNAVSIVVELKIYIPCQLSTYFSPEDWNRSNFRGVVLYFRTSGDS